VELKGTWSQLDLKNRGGGGATKEAWRRPQRQVIGKNGNVGKGNEKRRTPHQGGSPERQKSLIKGEGSNLTSGESGEANGKVGVGGRGEEKGKKFDDEGEY